MRKAFSIAVIAVVLVSPCILAQSTFLFQNYNPAKGIDAPVFDAQGNRLAGSDYVAELWGGAAANSLTATVQFSSGQRAILPFYSGAGAGYFYYSASMAVLQVAGGQNAWLQVRAWDARFGPTYESVEALGIGGYGESSFFYAMGGNPFADPPDAARPLIGLQSFSLREVVPEPSTWALLTLGGAALCWLSRRKL